jgi:hypothetical protein
MSRRPISTCRGRVTAHSDRGIALVMALLLTAFLTALCLALTTLSTIETWLSAGFRTSEELSYAADAALGRVQVDLAASGSWTALLVASATSAPSAFNDGVVIITLRDATVVDLATETRAVQAETDARCGSAPAMPDCPQWHLFAHAGLDRLVPGGLVATSAYVAAWIADDLADGDGDPLADANGRLLIRARAFGPGGARRSVEALVDRAGPGLRMLSWRELR